MRISDLILHNDHHIVVCNKPAGMPTQADKTGDKSLHDLAEAFCKRRLFIVHRLDRPVSGVVVFAKSKEAAATLSSQFAENKVGKTYLAVVSPGIDPGEGTLVHMLDTTRKSKTRIIEGEKDGKESRLDYKLVMSLDNYDVLEVHPQTGRTHQIRAQLGAAGHPVKGDVKYGARRGNKDRSIHLHCRQLEFLHPSTGLLLLLQAELPEEVLWQVVEAR